MVKALPIMLALFGGMGVGYYILNVLLPHNRNAKIFAIILLIAAGLGIVVAGPKTGIFRALAFGLAWSGFVGLRRRKDLPRLE